MAYELSNSHVTDDVTWPRRCCKAVRSAILATAWLLASFSGMTNYRIGPDSDFTCSFYRAMHFSAKRGIAIACRLSVRLSLCLSVTLVDCDHIGWNSSEIISPLVSLGCSLSADPNIMGLSKGNTPKFGPKMTHPLLIWASETFDRKLRPNGYR